MYRVLDYHPLFKITEPFTGNRRTITENIEHCGYIITKPIIQPSSSEFRFIFGNLF